LPQGQKKFWPRPERETPTEEEGLHPQPPILLLKWRLLAEAANMVQPQQVLAVALPQGRRKSSLGELNNKRRR
jgi:hypothetical protein